MRSRAFLYPHHEHLLYLYSNDNIFKNKMKTLQRKNSSKCIAIFLLWIATFPAAKTKQNKIINLGVSFSSENVLTSFFEDRLHTINKNLALSNISLNFEAVTFPLTSNPIQGALDVCENILNKQVYAVFINEDNVTNDAVSAISYTCGFFKVPVVGIGIRDAIFSDRVSKHWRAWSHRK